MAHNLERRKSLLWSLEGISAMSQQDEMLTPDTAAPEQVDLSTDAEPKSKVPGVALLRQASGINTAKLPDLKQIPGKPPCRVSLTGETLRTARHASTH